MATLLAMQKSLSSSADSLEKSSSFGGRSSDEYPNLEDYDFDGGRSLSNFGSEEEEYESTPRRQVKRSVSCEMKRAVQSLEYSPEDLEILACNSAQFEVLKQSLRKKGAITNEVLKQKLPLFLKYKKDRMAARNPDGSARGTPRRTKSASSATGALAQMSLAERQSSLKPANRVLTEEELQLDQPPPPQQGMIGRILRPNAKRNLPMRTNSSSSNGSGANGGRSLPQRIHSTGRSVPNRTSSLSRFTRIVTSRDEQEEQE